jgi:hypothetical protein
LKSIALDRAYNDERDVDVKERILLARRITSDKQPIETVAQELHKSSMGLQMVQKIHR